MLAREDPLWFSLIYLRYHFTCPLAPFHLEMFRLIQSTEPTLVVVMAFRESGKSTILNTVNALWSILGKPGEKFVLLIGETQEQAKNHFANIKAELENNELLKEDFGPFIENRNEWNKLSLELEYHGSKIISIPRGQSVRGLKHHEHRPGLIICDDLEDVASAADEEEGRALDEQFMREIVPLGKIDTRVFVLGNFLSHNSFIMRLKDAIEENRLEGIFRAYPLLDDHGKILWPSKFPNAESLKKLFEKITEATWKREYLLNASDWRGYYDSAMAAPNLSGDALIHWKYIQKRKEAERQYGYGLRGEKPQTPLIQHMGKFTISAPLTDSIPELETDDPKYPQYQTLLGKRKKLYEEYLNERRKARHARVIEEIRRAGYI